VSNKYYNQSANLPSSRGVLIMGKVIDFASGGKRNHFNKYKLWDVYKFTEDAIPSDCESHGRVIDITEEYVAFGFRKISNRRLKIVHLHPKDIQAKKVIDLYTQIRQRIFLLLEHPDCICR
jgi:hypothetical protein